MRSILVLVLLVLDQVPWAVRVEQDGQVLVLLPCIVIVVAPDDKGRRVSIPGRYRRYRRLHLHLRSRLPRLTLHDHDPGWSSPLVDGLLHDVHLLRIDRLRAQRRWLYLEVVC